MVIRALKVVLYAKTCFVAAILKFQLFGGNMNVMNVYMYSIGFIDLKNIWMDTKITVIGTIRIILYAKTCFVAAILNFQIFGGKRWSDIVVPAIFEISILENPLVQVFLLLTRSAHLRHISAPL